MIVTFSYSLMTLKYENVSSVQIGEQMDEGPVEVLVSFHDSAPVKQLLISPGVMPPASAMLQPIDEIWTDMRVLESLDAR